MDRFARRLQKLINSGKKKHVTGDGRTTRFKAQFAHGYQKLEVLVRKALLYEKPDKQRGVEHGETANHEPADEVYTPACLVDKEVTINQPTTIDKASSQANQTSLAPISNVEKWTRRALPTIQITPPADEAVINDGACQHNRVEDARSCLTVEATLESRVFAPRNTTLVQTEQEDLSEQCTDSPTTSVIPTDATSPCTEGDWFNELRGRDANSNEIHSVSPSEDDPTVERRAEQVETAGGDEDNGRTSETAPLQEEVFDEVASDSSETSVSSTELVNDTESPCNPHPNKSDQAEDQSAPVSGKEPVADEASLDRILLAAETKLSDGEGLVKGGNQVVDHKLVAVDVMSKTIVKSCSELVKLRVASPARSGNRNVESTRDASDYITTLEDFQTVIEALSLPALTHLALAIRKRYASNADEAKRINWCTVSEKPVFGSFNLVYFLTFNDGVKWVARLPGYGADPSHLQVEKIESEYNTMRYLRANTTFKIPEVFYWDSSTRSVGTACALMSFVPDQAPTQLWPSFNEKQRLTTIKTVAAEMAKLYCLQFPRTGMLRFDRCGEFPTSLASLGVSGMTSDGKK